MSFYHVFLHSVVWILDLEKSERTIVIKSEYKVELKPCCSSGEVGECCYRSVNQAES